MNHHILPLQQLKEILIRSGGMLISYSGGLDSTFLAVIAHEVTGGLERCVILDSPLLSRQMIQDAVKRADTCGFSCEVVSFPALDDPEFLQNPVNRCYLCKKRGAEILWRKAEEYGVTVVMDGVNHSDYNEFRPGILAADEAGILHPLALCGLTKPVIREIAKERGYPFWNIPSTPCLATRIPYGDMITSHDLACIGEAEEFLVHAGFPNVRVRKHANLARIEVPKDDIPCLLKNRDEISLRMRKLGFEFCTVDLEGLVSGSMDRALPPGKKKPGL